MVQLKESGATSKRHLVYEFQCQNGTIKSFGVKKLWSLRELFQCQNGTIKSTSQKLSNIIDTSFNAKMVQLKVN